jgi:sugar/nucleoside kinase (ribokinase family)
VTGVVCAGGAVSDLKLHLRERSVPGTSNPATAGSGFGGVARNVAENLATLLPGRVRLVSAVGDDDAGRALLTHASERGIDVAGVRVRPGRATARYVALLEPGGDLTIGAAAMDVLDEITLADLDAADPAGRAALFCDTNLTPAVLAHALSRGGAGRLVAVDAVSTAKVRKLPADLRGLTLLCCNADEAAAFLGVPGAPAELATGLRRAGATNVVLTLGADGVLAASAAGVEHVPAVPARTLDVTGAGDALVAGALTALIGGAGLADAARAGAERAARTVESPLSVLPAGPPTIAE